MHKMHTISELLSSYYFYNWYLQVYFGCEPGDLVRLRVKQKSKVWGLIEFKGRDDYYTHLFYNKVGQ